MTKLICMICEQERDSVKVIKGEPVCSMHVSESEWDEVEIPTKEEIGYKKEEKFNECEKCGSGMGRKMAGDE